jgi:hypothetical protein
MRHCHALVEAQGTKGHVLRLSVAPLQISFSFLATAALLAAASDYAR